MEKAATCTPLSLIATDSYSLTAMFALRMFESPTRNMHVGPLFSCHYLHARNLAHCTHESGKTISTMAF